MEVPWTRSGGILLALTGLGFAAAGVWAHREVGLALARERVVSTPDSEPPQTPVRSAGAARSMADVIRQRTLAATGGRTYAETAAYLDADGKPTADAGQALRDERTGQPIENPEHALWIQSMTLQNALMQAYVSARFAQLTTALGAALVVAGAGVASAGARR
jgi:hypothetical protein